MVQGQRPFPLQDLLPACILNTSHGHWGVIASVDEEMNALKAPSGSTLTMRWLRQGALTCVSMYDEMAGLGMGERIRNGPNEAYIAACKTL